MSGIRIGTAGTVGGGLTARLDVAHRLVRGHGADAAQLYGEWFHDDTGMMLDWPGPGAYLAAVARPATFEDGWTVVGPVVGPAGTVLVQRGDRRRMVAPPSMVPVDPRMLRPGSGARVRVHPLTGAESGGFWHLWSVGWQRRAPRRFRRIYLHLDPDGALEVVARIAASAPPRPVWAMKALCGIHPGGRRDGAVVYLPSRTPLDTGWVAAAVDAVRPWCRAGLPPFVDQIADGVGWAPDPGDGRSFGEAVCAAVARTAREHRGRAEFRAAAARAVAALPGMGS